MKVFRRSQIVILLFVLVISCMASCSGAEALRPIDRPNTKWSCTDPRFTFEVSETAEIINAGVMNDNGEVVDVTIVFSAVNEATFSVNSIDGEEVYFLGKCSYGKDKFTMTVTNIYNGAFSGLPLKLHFSKV